MTKRLFTTGTLILAMLVSILMPTLRASAVSASEWDAGNIIDDTVFTDTSRMNVADIQAFLNSQVPICDTSGASISELGGGTRAQYGASNGNPAPYTCLKDYYEVPKLQPGPDIPASNYGGTPIPPNAKSAAQIIWDAAQANAINPAVLLTKLATESAGPLTTDPWPFKKQYNYAMGAHCPDSGPNNSANCDSNYIGFSLQVNESASLLRWYLDNMNQPWWSYKKPYQVNNILWNVLASQCGGGDVYIQNNATAALYTYTPYQPNQAALNNLYGTGDGCSSYGNRNFWRVYSDLFGSTKGSIIRTYEDGRMYVRGSGNTYYYITNSEQLYSLGFGNTIKSYYNTSKNVLNGLTNAGDLPRAVRFNGGESVYLLDNGQKRYFDYMTYTAYGSPQVGDLSGELNNIIPTGSQLSDVVRSKGSFDLYVMINGKKRHLSATMYQSGGYSTHQTTVISENYFNSITKGAPLLAAGSLIQAKDTGVFFVITQNGEGRRQLDSNAAKSIARTVYTDTEGILGQLNTEQTAPISFLVKNASGDLFITDTYKKLYLSSAQLTATNLSVGNFTLVEDAYLNRFPTASTAGDLLLRIDNDERVYKVEAGKIIGIQTGDDFNKLGYNFSNVVTLTNNTVANLFMNPYRTIVLPGTLFRVNNTSLVYLFGSDNATHAIPTGKMFDEFRFNWTNIRIVSQATLTAYPTGSPLSYVIKTPDDAWWLISNGKRYWIPTNSRADYNSNINPLTNVPFSVLDRIIPAQNATLFIRINNDPMIYYIIGGQKRTLSQYTFTNLSGTLDKVLSISPYSASNFETGPTMY